MLTNLGSASEASLTPFLGFRVVGFRV